MNGADNTQPEKATGRLEAFSDGVFAIAITLLVLEIKVPTPGGVSGPTPQALWASVRSQWPSYFALVTSFFSVLIMWVHHHTVFRLTRRVDTRLLFANGLLLLFVSVVPFPTAIVAEYLTTPAAPAACALYAGFLLGGSIAFFLLETAAFRESFLDENASASTVRRLKASYRLGPPLYLIATIAAPFSPWLAMGICTALWILWAVTTREC
ncbi:MAG: TMEM175 family protein [Bryobacteraceae bacterium]